MKKSFFLPALLLCAAACAPRTGDGPPGTPGREEPGGGSAEAAPGPDGEPGRPRAVFEAMEKAVREGDEEAFRRQWHPRAWEANLVGGSGVAGRSVFRQAVRKKWYLRAGEGRAFGSGLAYVFPCRVWAWAREESVDEVSAALGLVDERWLVLGAGEEPGEVEALVRRFLRGEDLAPSER